MIRPKNFKLVYAFTGTTYLFKWFANRKAAQNRADKANALRASAGHVEPIVVVRI